MTTLAYAVLAHHKPMQLDVDDDVLRALDERLGGDRPAWKRRSA